MSRFLFEPLDATRIKHAIHDLNLLLYSNQTEYKKAKLPKTIEPQHSHTPPIQNNLVSCIPEDLSLSHDEKSILSKGLNFIPLTPKADSNQTMLLLQRFFRTIRWTAQLDGVPSRPLEEDIFLSLFGKKSGRLPPEGKFKAVENYISKTSKDITSLHPRPLSYSNISPGELSAIRSLQRRDDIVIKPADKGGKVVVWARDLYISEATRQLNNVTHYEKLSSNSLDKDSKLIGKAIREEIASGTLPKTATLLLVKRPRQPCFYMLPKIHKVDTPGRPIVSACSCPTEHISNFLDTIFQPIVQSLPSYIKDSTDALLKLQSINFTPSYVLTMDVTALYTNIPHHDGLLALQVFLNRRSESDPPTHTLLRLAELVLTMNTFEFDGTFYRQTSGVAMGTKMGPSYACLFMGHLEEQMRNTYTGPFPEFYGRFIDDCLALSSLTEAQLIDFVSFANSLHPAIKFTYEISNTQNNFLDIIIRIVDGRISTSIFYKPTDAHAYLDFNSSHSRSTRSSIPFSQFLRLHRLCMEDDDFLVSVP